MDARRAWRAAMLVAACLLVSGLPVAHASSSSSSDERDLLARLNRERTRRGLRALTHASDLASVARRHSARMASARRVFHNRNLGSEVQGWRYVGENVAAGPSAGDVHSTMMKSAEHRNNILDTDYAEVGVGVVVRGTALYVTQVLALRARIPAPPKASRARHVRRRPPATPRPVPPKPAPVVAPSVRSVTMLLRVLAMDDPVSEPPAPERSSPPVRDR